MLAKVLKIAKSQMPLLRLLIFYCMYFTVLSDLLNVFLQVTEMRR